MGKHVISLEALSFVGWWVGTFGFNTIITFLKHEVPSGGDAFLFQCHGAKLLERTSETDVLLCLNSKLECEFR